MANSVDLGNN